ncbi:MULTISPECIES: MFS transporter [unclassified Crossiella]|uniref:MFS transporter n=1 Tax=unclassified Crossiella TaxID=2620835 RepID=UPI001FFFF2BD|nr:MULTISPECIES: MFS transporter [unclassified Crossiella]MCK2241313.1 MFS transporter [Crossiella sp. S99.2]MCK2253543.1 MFS transporter [Crossiella sp. S99.1]
MRTPRYRYVVFGLLVVVALVNYIDRGALSYAAGPVIAEFGFSTGEWGQILGFFGYGYMFGALIGGWAADRLGARRVWLWAGAAWSALEVASAFAGEIGIGLFGGSALAGFAVVRVLFGFAEGPAYSTINRTMADWAAPRERGFAVSVGLLSTPLGALLTAPVSVGLLTLTGNWRVTFIVLGVAGFALLLVFYRLFRDKPEQHPRVSPAELAHIRAESGPEAPAGQPIPVRAFFTSRTLLLNAVGYFAFMFVNFTIQTWVPKYLQDQFQFSLGSLWYLGMIPWIGACVTILLGGRITDALRRRTGNLRIARNLFAVLAMAATSVCFLLIPLMPDATSVLALMALGNALNSLPNAVFWAVIIDTAPARAGTFGGFTHFIANIAAVAAPTLAGYLAATYGYGSIFVAAGVATAVGMCAMAFLRPGQLGRAGSGRRDDAARASA